MSKSWLVVTNSATRGKRFASRFSSWHPRAHELQVIDFIVAHGELSSKEPQHERINVLSNKLAANLESCE